MNVVCMLAAIGLLLSAPAAAQQPVSQTYSAAVSSPLAIPDGNGQCQGPGYGGTVAAAVSVPSGAAARGVHEDQSSGSRS
jgi:hypothetical protein